MSDNLLLTVLGAVGVGALLYGMNQENKVKENWLNVPIRAQAQRVTLDKNNIATAVNFAKTPVQLQDNLQTLARLERSGVTNQAAQIASITAASQARANNSRAQLATVARQQSNVETFVPPSTSLGANAVTRNDYVSYPQFNQSTPLQSPSLNLPAQIRYNPPSLNKMGITTAYQSSMDHAGLVEGFETPAQQTYVSTSTGNPEGGGLNKTNKEYIANKQSWSQALSQGTAQYSDNKDLGPINNNLPLNTMDTPGVSQNTMLYDSFIYANARNGGWRASSSGSSDLIRGDLAVNVDPCQKGWFQSSLTPSDLRKGAIQIITGEGSGSSAGDASKLSNVYGNMSSLANPNTGRMSTLQKALSGTNANTIAAISSFA